MTESLLFCSALNILEIKIDNCIFEMHYLLSRAQSKYIAKIELQCIKMPSFVTLDSNKVMLLPQGNPV